MHAGSGRLPENLEACIKLCVEDLHELFANEAKWDVVRVYFSHVYNMGLRKGAKPFLDRLAPERRIVSPSSVKKPYVGKTAKIVKDRRRKK